jgi:hypothetical protein
VPLLRLYDYGDLTNFTQDDFDRANVLLANLPLVGHGIAPANITPADIARAEDSPARFPATMIPLA